MSTEVRQEEPEEIGRIVLLPDGRVYVEGIKKVTANGVVVEWEFIQPPIKLNQQRLIPPEQ